MLKQTLKQFNSAGPKKKKNKEIIGLQLNKQSGSGDKKSAFVLGLSLVEMRNKEFIFGPILSKVALLQCKTTPKKKKLSIQNFKGQSWSKRKHKSIYIIIDKIERKFN